MTLAFGGRCRTRMPSASRKIKTAIRTCVGGRHPAFAGSSGADPAACARQDALHGHSSHLGVRGTQSVAPSSIMACVKSPRRPSGTTSIRAWPAVPRDRSEAELRRSRRSSANRASTRWALPSSAALGSSKAMLAMAAAVYLPIPGKRRRAMYSPGSLHHIPQRFASPRRAACARAGSSRDRPNSRAHPVGMPLRALRQWGRPPRNVRSRESPLPRGSAGASPPRPQIR